jgi:hypothetical protein
MAQGILRSLVIAHLAWGLVSLLASAASAQTTGQAPDGNPSRDLPEWHPRSRVTTRSDPAGP